MLFLGEGTSWAFSIGSQINPDFVVMFKQTTYGNILLRKNTENDNFTLGKQYEMYLVLIRVEQHYHDGNLQPHTHGMEQAYFLTALAVAHKSLKKFRENFGIVSDIFEQ
jgi:hypothetical protein